MNPKDFGILLEEEKAVRAGCGISNVSSRSKIKVAGADRIAFLNQILTNDIKSLRPGEGAKAALLLANGKILLWMNVLIFQDDILLDLAAGLEEKALALLDRYLITEDVQLTKLADFGHLLLFGKNASLLAASFCPIKIPTRGIVHQAFPLAGREAFLTANRLRQEIFYEIIIPEFSGKAATDELLVRGKSSGLAPMGSAVYEIFRIEHGIPEDGKEIKEDTLLPETGLEDDAASETKGCYPGQEVVARIKTYHGLNRKLMGLIFEEGSIPQAQDKILIAGENGAEKEIGWVMSACVSPVLKKGFALAYLGKGYFNGGIKVEVLCGGKTIMAETSALPFQSQPF